MAREFQPDIILMDLAMPGMDGLAATRALKEHPETSGIPVLAVTGLVFGTQRILKAGCDGYLTKPLTRAQLLAGICQVLRPGRVDH
jgi:two-component system cell cycle response regulator DivK